MASLYTRAADRARLAKSAMPKMAGRTTSEHSIPAPSGCGSDRGKISDFRGLVLWWCGRELCQQLEVTNGLRQGEGHKVVFKAQKLFSRLPCPSPSGLANGSGALSSTAR